MSIESNLVNWYINNKRDLPWRNTKNPYHIWISEVILQQTRVDQALSYYHSFLENFPTVEKLANSEEHTILKIWQGLGYYSRARNLHFSAKYIMNELNGRFPENFRDLKLLKGVGEYTAAAIASIVFNEKVSVVDGNVFRVLSRLYAESTPINSSKGKKLFFELATNLLNSQEPQLFNQAIMEFGALQCKPQNPECSICVLREYCLAYSTSTVSDYPVKINSIKKKYRFLYYLVILDNNYTYIKKRDSKDIWQGLYEFPVIETDSQIDFRQIIQMGEWKKWIGDNQVSLSNMSNPIIHQLTHQQLNIVFISLNIDSLNSKFKELEQNFHKIQFDDIYSFPVPKPIESFIKQINLK